VQHSESSGNHRVGLPDIAPNGKPVESKLRDTDFSQHFWHGRESVPPEMNPGILSPATQPPAAARSKRRRSRGALSCGHCKNSVVYTVGRWRAGLTIPCPRCAFRNPISPISPRLQLFLGVSGILVGLAAAALLVYTAWVTP